MLTSSSITKVSPYLIACRMPELIEWSLAEGGERSVEDGDTEAETVLHEFGPVGHVSTYSQGCLIGIYSLSLLSRSLSPSLELAIPLPR